MIFYLIFLTTISISSFSFLFFLMNEIQNYIKKNNQNNNNNETETLNSKQNNNLTTTTTVEKYEDKYLTQLRNKNSNSKNNSKLEDEENQSSKEKYKNYKNNILIEKTPIGNVAMFYDSVSETFTYYSDNAIPYRFLEVVARRYVLLHNCIELYIDMEEELEKKKLLDKQLKDKKLEEIECNQNHSQNQNTNSDKLEKKSVFAKFKSYNKEAGSGRVNSAPPPKNSIPSNNNFKSNTEPCILKEEANRYLCKGRFSNFNILQKVDRKKIDKKYALNFADFKKMTESN